MALSQAPTFMAQTQQDHIKQQNELTRNLIEIDRESNKVTAENNAALGKLTNSIIKFIRQTEGGMPADIAEENAFE
jgi:uncharacterized protein YPO0396